METNNRETIPLDEGLGTIIFSILRGKVDTVTVGLVESYDPDSQIVTVQPAIMRRRESEDEAKPRPVLADVRIVFPGSGDYWVTFPISQGDPVLLLAPSRSLDNWLNSGGIVDPDSDRIFDLSDAIAIPGILNDGAIIPELKNDGFYLRTRETGGFAALPLLDPTLPNTFIKLSDGEVQIGGDLNVVGDINVLGDVVGNIMVAGVSTGTVSLLNHVHPTAAVGPPSPPTPDPPVPDP